MKTFVYILLLCGIIFTESLYADVLRNDNKFICRVEDETAYIALGTADGLEVGTEFIVLRSAIVKVHPITSEPLEMEDIIIGRLSVIEVDKGFSKAKIIEQTKEFYFGDRIEYIAGPPPSFTNRYYPENTIINPPTPTQTHIVKYKDINKIYNQALSFCVSYHTEEAKILFLEIINNYPNSNRMENSLYWLGHCYYNEGDYGMAIEQFHKVLDFQNARYKDDDAQLMIGICYYNLNELDKAITSFQKLTNLYSKSEYCSVSESWIERCENDPLDKYNSLYILTVPFRPY